MINMLVEQLLKPSIGKLRQKDLLLMMRSLRVKYCAASVVTTKHGN